RSSHEHRFLNDQKFRVDSCRYNMNERITEDFVRSHFKSDAMSNAIKLEEQKSNNDRIKKLLSKASKKGSGNQGYPEFIITFPSIIDAVIIVECKPNIRDHERRKRETTNSGKYAVDGVLHYANFLKDDFNVVALAVSGEKTEQIIISDFLIKKNTTKVIPLNNNKLLTVYEYLNIFEEKEEAEKLKDTNLLVFAADLNQKLYNYSIP